MGHCGFEIQIKHWYLFKENPIFKGLSSYLGHMPTWKAFIFKNIGLTGEKYSHEEKYPILLIYNFWGFLN